MGFDVIVIGGGLGGLSAGAILSRQGKRVLLLEQHYIPGGCATTFKRKDFIMEAGLHAMDGHLIAGDGPRSVLRYLGVKKKVEFQKVPEFFRIKNSRFDFTFPNGTEEAIEALIKAYPEEESGIRRFFKVMMGVQEELSGFPHKRWRQALVIPLFPFMFPNIMKTFRRTAGHFLERYIKSDELKLILQGNLLYYHDDPYTMSMVFFSKAQASFIHYGGYFVKGGSQKLSNALAEVITEHGGSILLGKRVNRILIKNGVAVGVSYKDAFNENLEPVTLEASHIIHSGAVPLLKNLLPGPEKAKIARKIDRLKPACSLFCIYLGFKREVRQLNHHHYSTFFYSDDIRSLDDVVPNIYGDWNARSFVFVDYSQVDSGLAPEGKSFGSICAASLMSEWDGMDDAAYKKKKKEVARILIDKLEENIPGIRDLIESYEVATPATIRRYTLNPSGAPYGFAQIPSQVGTKRPSYKSPVKNLWLAGTWTFPGGGFTGAIVSGFLCGMKVSKKIKPGQNGSESKTPADKRIVKLIRRQEIAANTIELTFEKPEGFTFQSGQHAIVSLNNPEYTELDMPFRALSMASHPDDSELKFVMRKGSSSFKRSCASLKAGDTATIYGPAGRFSTTDTNKG
ncbi:MAG: FAD-dependent oxidoreductase [Bacteroidota bacterium]